MEHRENTGPKTIGGDPIVALRGAFVLGGSDGVEESSYVHPSSALARAEPLAGFLLRDQFVGFPNEVEGDIVFTRQYPRRS